MSLSLSLSLVSFPLWLKGLAGVLWRNEFIFSEFPGLEGMKKTGMWACSLVGRDDKLLFFLSIFLSLWICPELYGRVFTPRRFFSPPCMVLLKALVDNHIVSPLKSTPFCVLRVNYLQLTQNDFFWCGVEGGVCVCVCVWADPPNLFFCLFLVVIPPHMKSRSCASAKM